MIDLPALTYPPDFLTAPIFLDSRRFPSQFFDNRWSLASEDGARPMSLMGQNRKSSMRAYVFRFAPKSGHCATESACPFRANNGSQSHSITSSARASSDGGTSRPSAFAALRLMTSSNLVGCSTGRFAGDAPFRILSTYSAARRPI